MPVDYDAYPLEPSPAEMRAMTERALDYLTRFVHELPDAPAMNLDDVWATVEKLKERAPEEGADFEDLLPIVEEGVAQSFNAAGPGYLAYIPGGGLFAASLGQFIAGVTNRFVNRWSPAPALAQMEWQVVQWLIDLFGYPDGAMGILTTGGSMANLSAIVTARRARLPEDFLSGTLYASEQTHASIYKAAFIAGFSERNLRRVKVTRELRMDVDDLARQVQEDRALGLLPFCVIGNAGTTNTGAVDRLDELADLAQQEGLWLHIDAAYGGPFQLTERGRGLFRGIERSDSLTLDPHKAMFLPYGTGSLLVREGSKLRDAHVVHAEYLQDLAEESEIPNFTDYSPELSREFRGLRVWLPIKLHGLKAFRDALDEKLDLTRYLHERLSSEDRFEIPWEPELTVVAFRYLPSSGDVDDFNARLLERINESRRIFVSSTLVDGNFILRACIVSFRTHRDRIEEAADIIIGAARELESTQ